MSGSLQHIADLLKQKSYDQARAELRVYLQAHPDHAEAWYLLSFAAPDRPQRIAALQRALKLKPDLELARSRLAQLRAESPAESNLPPRAPSRTPRSAPPTAPPTAPPRRIGWGQIVGGLIAVLLVGGIGALAVTRLAGSDQDASPAPTLAELPGAEAGLALSATAAAVAALGDATGTPAVSPTVSPTAVDTPTATASPTGVDTPTATVSPTGTATPEPVVLPSDTPTEVSPTVPVITAAPLVSPTPKSQATGAAIPVIGVPTAAPTGAPPDIVPLAPTATVAPSATRILPPSATPTATLEGLIVLPSPTSTKTPVPTATYTPSPVPTATTPPDVPVPTGPGPASSPTPYIAPTPSGSGIPLNTFAGVTGGRAMVISAARPATAAINEIGATAPNPPAGSEWVLVEVLAECNDSACTLARQPLRVLGSSGQVYDPAPTFQSDVKFGPGMVVNRQAWGYQAFLVPSSEQSVRLVIQGVEFALQ